VLRKYSAITRLATRSAVSIADAPIDRSRDGKLSDAYTHTSEPKPKLKPAVNTNTPMKPSQPVVFVRSPTANTTISSSVETNIAAMPLSSVGRRPSRSTTDSDATVAISEPTWTSAGSSSSDEFPVKPISLKIIGL